MTLSLEFWHASIKIDGFIAVKRKVGLLTMRGQMLTVFAAGSR